MAIPDAPLQLRDYAVTALEYRRRLTETPQADHPLSMRLEIEGAENGGLTYLVLRIWINEDEASTSDLPPNPHEGRIEVRGEFEWLGPEDISDRDRLVVVNGLSILYGIARVHIAQASGTGPDRRLLLPSVSFHEIDLPLTPPEDQESEATEA